MELYYAVLDWNADAFKKQSFKGVGKKRKKKRMSIQNELTSMC